MTVSTEELLRTGGFAFARVNLLPPEIEERKRFRRLQLAMGGAVVVAVAAVGVLYAGAHGSVTSAQHDLDATSAQTASLQQQLSSLQSVSETYAQVSARQAMLQQAMSDEIQWSHYLNDLGLRIPDNVFLTAMTVTTGSGSTATTTTATTPSAAPLAGSLTGGGTVTFTGIAFSYDDVAAWLESLAHEKGYANPYFTSSTETMIGQRKFVSFTSTVTLTSDALSGRYTKPAGS